MGLIKGIPIILFEKEQTGTDGFGAPIWRETQATVQNVLIKPVEGKDAAEAFDLTGKKVVFELSIPKGDTHDWTNKKVSFFGNTFRTVGIPTELIARMVPLDWNRKIQVERYE